MKISIKKIRIAIKGFPKKEIAAWLKFGKHFNFIK